MSAPGAYKIVWLNVKRTRFRKLDEIVYMGADTW